jgi:predicted O-methyltransferase YrrM
VLPPLVERAIALAEELGFERSCSPETGRLLQVLAAQRGRTRVGEIGAGCGVGSAWILSTLDPAATFVTVEPDRGRADGVARLLANDPNARVLHARWQDVLPAEAPFDLLFADGGGQATKTEESLLGLLTPGGTLVLDDLTPGYAGHDPVRELWHDHPRLVAAEIRISAREAAIVGTLQPR